MPDREKSTLSVAAVVVVGWALGISFLSLTHGFDTLSPYQIAALVAAGVVLPTVAYFAIPRLQMAVQGLGLRPITAFHAWRIPAAAVFFWYGSQGLLPETFVARAAWGDLIAGVLAILVVNFYPKRSGYLIFHVIGMADFISAVGTGLSLTLSGAPQMRTITQFPIALIPFFGVGLSGATHLIAFHLLFRRKSL